MKNQNIKIAIFGLVLALAPSLSVEAKILTPFDLLPPPAIELPPTDQGISNNIGELSSNESLASSTDEQVASSSEPYFAFATSSIASLRSRIMVLQQLVAALMQLLALQTQ